MGVCHTLTHGEEEDMKLDKQINTALMNLALAIAEWAAVRNGLITSNNFPDKVDWTLDSGEVIHIDSPFRRSGNLDSYATNQLRAAWAISVIQTDSALESKYGSQPLNDKDADRRAARCSIKKMRCCFAHNPLEPI